MNQNKVESLSKELENLSKKQNKTNKKKTVDIKDQMEILEWKTQWIKKFTGWAY